MEQTNSFSKTAAQHKATKLLAGKAKHLMLYGGSRSGKTFMLVYAVVVRAAKVQSRHAILRLNFNHAKTSIWLDTLPKVLDICFPDLPVKWNNSDYYITLPNGSEIWISGLDEKKRVEKILGKEYSTLYFNECSQIPYESILIAVTRLAEKNSLAKKCYYDENPPSRKHWSYWRFIKNTDPVTGEDFEPDTNACMVMNPADNIENIDEDYLKLLEQLPEKERQRFLFGEFTESDDGLAYYEFNREIHCDHVKFDPSLPILIGSDFNVNPMTSVIAQYGDGVFRVFDEVYIENSDTPGLCDELRRRGYHRAKVYPDSTGSSRKTTGLTDFKILNDYGFMVQKTRNPHVNDRVNNLNRLLKSNKIIIDKGCKKLINDLEKVSWKDNKLDQKSDPMLTHISDALCYLTWALDNGLIMELPKNFKFTQRRGR